LVEASFGSVIKEHLELQRRNRHLDGTMPLDRYLDQPAVANHALFRAEATAQAEERPQPDEWPTREDGRLSLESPEELWSSSPSFDWGD
jgi:hypothetical protein